MRSGSRAGGGPRPPEGARRGRATAQAAGQLIRDGRCDGIQLDLRRFQTVGLGRHDDAARVRLAIESAHGIAADEVAVTDALAFLKAYRAKAAERGVKPEGLPLAAWSAFARVLLTSNAFLFVD